jgi:hypothetical protein
MNKQESVCEGFIASILEDKKIGNCSNRGISYWAKEVTIVTDIPELQIFETYPKDELNRPLVVIKKKKVCGEEYVYAEPIDEPTGVGWMMGGTFIYSTDSRFRQFLNKYPIPLHDRQETAQEYERNSQ